MNNAIALDERFSDFELSQMFNVDCNPQANRSESARARTIAGEYVFNDIMIPLWTNHKRTPSRGEKAALQTEDNIKEGVSNHPVGSKDRVADLARFYAENGEAEKSAFYV